MRRWRGWGSSSGGRREGRERAWATWVDGDGDLLLGFWVFWFRKYRMDMQGKEEGGQGR